MGNHARANYERMAGARKVFQATIKRNRWGQLFDEFQAQGWRPVKVDRFTGARTEGKDGVWVMRYVGFDGDEAVKFAGRCSTVKVKSRYAA